MQPATGCRNRSRSREEQTPSAAPRRGSERVTWEAIVAAEPEIVLLLRCGLTLGGVAREARVLAHAPEWRTLPAVASGAVWALDADAWFRRPGPRLIEGIDALKATFAAPAGRAPIPGGRRLRRRNQGSRGLHAISGTIGS